MEDFSDSGYAYLGELLASRGLITVSVDENFLNGSWSSELGGENAARGWILLQHLALWRAWNDTSGNPFYKKVDMSNIALVGHSRGGEAITHAAAFNTLPYFPDDARVRFNFHFSIKSLIALAPIDGEYEPAGRPVRLENVNYMVLQGSHDSGVPFFAGFRPYKRIRFTDGRYWCKAALNIYRANHSQFNTVWGIADEGPPLRHFINLRPLLKGEEQRRIAKVYISAFLEATLRGKKEYLPMFQDHHMAAGWLPRTIYFSQFEDSRFKVVSDYDGGIDLSKTTVPGGSQAGENLAVWREMELKGRSDWPFQKKAVLLGWDTAEAGNGRGVPDRMPGYSLTLPEGLARQWRLDENSQLVFSVADAGQGVHQRGGDYLHSGPGEGEKANQEKEPIDFTLELVSAGGFSARAPLSQFFPLQRALKVRFTKWNYLERRLYTNAVELGFQSYELPLSTFVKASPGFSPADLKTIRFCFDRTRSGLIILDTVGFATESPRGNDIAGQ